MAKKIVFDNVHFSITMAYKDLKFSFYSLHVRSEGTLSQIVYIVNLGLGFLFYVKKKKFLKFVSIIFEVT